MKRHKQTSEQRDQGLDNAVEICSGVRVRRLILGERGCNDEQWMWVGTHAMEPINQHRAFYRERVD